MSDETQQKRAAAGGKARSASLSKAEKRSIAAKGGAERAAMLRSLPKETHKGLLKLAGGIPCSVLGNGMRVLSTMGLTRAFDAKSKGGKADEEGGETTHPLIAATNLQPFISDDLRQKLSNPVRFRGMHGGRVALGYEAEILSRICDVWLDARAAGVLRKSQLHIAAAAELMMRGFAQVGIVALIDEATGYQAERARDELYKILEQYIAKELLPWTKKFPDDFFEQIYRVHGWKYQAGITQRPGYVGKFINRFVYEQLPDGVLAELHKKNPPVNGRRQLRHHQLLTEHTGNPHLDRQIVATTTIMKLSEDKEDFKVKFVKLYPQRGDRPQLELDLDLDDVVTKQPAMSISSDLMGVEGSARWMIMDMLRDGNTKATKDIARHAYKKDGPATLNTARALLNRLRDEQVIETPSPGLWRLRASAG